MPFTSQDFEPISPERMHPLVAALNYANQNRELAQKIAEARARTGLIGSQQTGKELENEKARQLMQFVTPGAQIAQQEAQAKANQAAYTAARPSFFAPPELQLYEYDKETKGQGRPIGGPMTPMGGGGGGGYGVQPQPGAGADQPLPQPISAGGQPGGGGGYETQTQPGTGITQPQPTTGGTPQEQLTGGLNDLQQQEQRKQQRRYLEDPMAEFQDMDPIRVKLNYKNDPAFKQKYDSAVAASNAMTNYSIKQSNDALQSAKEMPQVQQFATGLRSSYDKAGFKGVSSFGTGADRKPMNVLSTEAWKPENIWGTFKQIGHDFSPEQQAKIASQHFMTKLMPLFKGGPTEKEFFGPIQSMKPGLENEPDAFHDQMDIIQADIDRTGEWNNFLQAAIAKGYKNPYAREKMFLNYQASRPALDDDNKVMWEHTQPGSSKEFLNDDNYMASLQGKPYEIINYDEIKHTAEERKKSHSDKASINDVIRDMQEQGRITQEQARKFMKERK